jgi:hypothetical protein
MGESLGPAACLVVTLTSAESVVGVELLVVERDAPLDATAVFSEKPFLLRRIADVPVRARRGGNRDAVRREGLSLLGLGPIGVVAQEPSLKEGLEKGIEPLTVVPVPRHLHHEGHASLGCEDEMFADADEPAVQSRAVSQAG